MYVHRSPLVLLAVLTLFGMSNLSAQSKNKAEALSLQEGGVLSTQAQPIGDPSLGSFAERFPGQDWHYLETAHFRLASSLGPQELNKEDRKRMASELDELRLYFPELPAKVGKLSPKIYLFLMSLRVERLYADFQKLVQVTDADFPTSRAAQKGLGAYMGDGPFLGEREKYEIILHDTHDTHADFSFWQRGVKVNDTARWHCRKPSKMILSMPCADSDLRKDRWMWPHIAHNVVHNMLDGFKFFAYDSPLWLAEGIALYFEQRIEPDSWTREGGEGVFFERQRSRDWHKEVVKLVRKNKTTPMAKLMHAKHPADLDRVAHISAWSLVEFLSQNHAEDFAQFVGHIKSQLDDRGYPTGRNMLDLQRKLWKQIWGWTPMQVDQAWKEWVDPSAKKRKKRS
jgi:uncharacterized protein DUF1570